MMVAAAARVQRLRPHPFLLLVLLCRLAPQAQAHLVKSLRPLRFIVLLVLEEHLSWWPLLSWNARACRPKTQLHSFERRDVAPSMLLNWLLFKDTRQEERRSVLSCDYFIIIEEDRGANAGAGSGESRRFMAFVFSGLVRPRRVLAILDIFP
jgi:hypothetical protein